METIQSHAIGSEKTTLLQFKHDTVLFTPNPVEIEYFKLTSDLFSPAFATEIKQVDFKEDKYLSIEKHLTSLDLKKSETVVFNFQTGKGKTEVCYNLIQEYTDAGYHVIVCSPFKRLVEKDYAVITKRYNSQPVAFNYLDLKNDEEITDKEMQEIIERPVQIMTINCLLQNPGKKYPDQSLLKRRYLKSLKEHITKTGDKVVFFFDEIHDSIENFESRFFKHLLDWENLTHKCFISSATYTPASIPVLQYISMLTDVQLKIFQAERTRNKVRANLRLHLISEPYHRTKLHSLNHISTLIRRYKKQERKINILSGYKSIVDVLTNPKIKKEEQNYIREYVLGLSPNIITNDTPNEFDQNKNNIGTAFTTGVNIESENAVLIIIIPAIDKSNVQEYGLFTDGIPSIIQSISRVRNGGDIHIFMLAPHTIIDLENQKKYLSDTITENTIAAKYYTPNQIYKELEKTERIKEQRSPHGTEILMTLHKFDPSIASIYSFSDYLVRDSEAHIVNKYESMGKYLSPYLLWAAINDQFCNAELTEIIYQSRYHKDIQLTNESMAFELSNLLSSNQKNNLKKLSIREGFKDLPNHLESSVYTTISSDGIEESIQYLHRFKYNKKTHSNITTLKKNNSFNNALLTVVCNTSSGGNYKEIDRDIYIRTCIYNSSQLQEDSGNAEELTTIYRQLDTLKTEFIQHLQPQLIPLAESSIIHKDYSNNFPDEWVIKAIEVVRLIKEKDGLIKCFSFFQKPIDLNSEIITESVKNTVVKFFEACFTNVTDTRRTYNGEKNGYYLVSSPLSNDTYLNDIDFMK